MGVQRAERSSGWVPGRVSWREGSDETREIIMDGPQWSLSLPVTDPTNTVSNRWTGPMVGAETMMVSNMWVELRLQLWKWGEINRF